MDDHYYNVSRRLYDVLEWIGASDEMRRAYAERAIVHEILLTMHFKQSSFGIINGVYIFGSSCEGTTTPGLNSDIDLLFCWHFPMVESVSDAPRLGLSYVMVRDESTKPGYVKLQTVINGVGQTIYHGETLFCEDTDHQGRICTKHLAPSIAGYLNGLERNGPALSLSGYLDVMDIDAVIAYKCSHIPTFAQSWMSRERPHYWPRPHQIDKMARIGCFFVGVQHPSSLNGHIEWRVSFSLQERELMLTLNPTQHKCYVLLKMIKKDIIHKSVRQSISSYHCKTCLFYTIENTPAVFWASRNLLECTRVCIKLLLHWVRKRNCPNFFIPEENMFDRLKPETLRKAQTILEDILEHWYVFLWSLTTDGIGHVLYDVLYGCGPGVLCVKNSDATFKHIGLYISLQSVLSHTITDVLKEMKCRSPTELLNQLYRFKVDLSHTDHVTEHTGQDIRLAISYFMPHVYLQMAQCLASIMLNIRDERLVRIMFRAFMYCISESRDCDMLSTNFLVASFCLQSGRFETCEKYLLDCEIALRPHILAVCGCNDKNTPSRVIESLKQFSQHVHREPLTFRHFRTYFTSCIAFPPCQFNLVPPALRYEMYRSVGTPHAARDSHKEKYRSANTPSCSRDNHKQLDWDKYRVYWFDWIVVDPKVYLYFLQYTLYTYTNKPVCKQDALDNLVHVIRRDKNLGHKETAYNLLGWIYKQERKHEQAMDCFLTSWRIRPYHNAAKWHGIELIRSVNMSV